jgi:hypothetical protein
VTLVRGLASLQFEPSKSWGNWRLLVTIVIVCGSRLVSRCFQVTFVPEATVITSGSKRKVATAPPLMSNTSVPFVTAITPSSLAAPVADGTIAARLKTSVAATATKT